MLRSLPRLLVLAALAGSASVRAEDLRERDLDALVGRSTLVARAEVVAVSSDGLADLHVITAYLELGERAGLVRVRPEGQRAMAPAPGDRGLYFLGPSQAKPGALTFVQQDFERWQLEPDPAADAAVDAFMVRLVEAATGDKPAPMDDVWVDGLLLPVPSLSSHCARRLAALGERGGIGNRGWDRISAWLQQPGQDEGKAAAVAALSKVLPAPLAVSLLPRLADGSKVKAAVLAATGARASASGEQAKEEARAALDAAGSDGSPRVALGVALGLAALGDEKAIPALEQALRSSDVESRHRAVEAMAALATRGSRAARTRLHKLFEDPDGIVRAKARTAWVDAYLADPVRQKRTQPSFLLVAAALAMVLVVAGHSLLVRSRT